MPERKGKMDKGLIVTSAHLATGEGASLSEFEFGLNLANNSFQRWMIQCMTASGRPDLSALDIQILHVVNHRDRSKRVGDLCIMLNIDDTHVVTYSLKKLQNFGLLTSLKKGSEKLFKTSTAGVRLCLEYREIREKALVNGLKSLGDVYVNLHDLATALRALSGFYDQAARAAASM